MMVAAVIILTSVMGIYSLQRDHAKDLELDNIVIKIRDAIDEFNALYGEARANVTFSHRAEGVHVKSRVNGKGYEILISQYKVILTQDSRRSSTDLAARIHLWKPEFPSYNLTEIENMDSEHKTLEFESGEDFKIERKHIDIGGEPEYRTFVYI